MPALMPNTNTSFWKLHGTQQPAKYVRNMPLLGLEGTFYDDIFAGYYIRRQVYFNALAGLKKGGDGVALLQCLVSNTRSKL